MTTRIYHYYLLFHILVCIIRAVIIQLFIRLKFLFTIYLNHSGKCAMGLFSEMRYNVSGIENTIVIITKKLQDL